MANYEDICDYIELRNKEDLDVTQQAKKKEYEEANPTWKDLDKNALEKEQQKIALEALIEYKQKEEALTEEETQRQERILRENESLKEMNLKQLQAQLKSFTTPKEQRESKAAIIGEVSVDAIRQLAISLFGDKFNDKKLIREEERPQGAKGPSKIIVKMDFDDFEKMLLELADQGKSFRAHYSNYENDGVKKIAFTYECSGGTLVKTDMATNAKSDMNNQSLKDKLKNMKDGDKSEHGSTLAPGR